MWQLWNVLHYFLVCVLRSYFELKYDKTSLLLLSYASSKNYLIKKVTLSLCHTDQFNDFFCFRIPDLLLCLSARTASLQWSTTTVTSQWRPEDKPSTSTWEVLDSRYVFHTFLIGASQLKLSKNNACFFAFRRFGKAWGGFPLLWGFGLVLKCMSSQNWLLACW
jgi:hypothetical protein